jgi:hypothetical protein
LISAADSVVGVDDAGNSGKPLAPTAERDAVALLLLLPLLSSASSGADRVGIGRMMVDSPNSADDAPAGVGVVRSKRFDEAEAVGERAGDGAGGDETGGFATAADGQSSKLAKSVDVLPLPDNAGCVDAGGG